MTQADVDAGEINNTVTAKGKDPKDADVTGTASAKVTTEEAADRHLRREISSCSEKKSVDYEPPGCGIP